MLGIAILFAATTVAQNAGRVALLVQSTDAAALQEALTTALDAPDPLVRATAARVATVRNTTALLPKLREVLASESDPNAAREEVRATVILGEPDDVDRAAKRPGMLDVIARAAARRPDAYDVYLAKLRPLGFVADVPFFKQALWQRGPLAAVTARVLGHADAGDWRTLLLALRESNVAVDANILSAALNAPSEDIRTHSVWYLVHGYAFDPSKIAEPVRTALASPSQDASLREACGRELLRRMLGGERREDPRWLDWLQSEEADALIRSETTLFEVFTDKEFAARKNHCDIASNDCRMPPSKKVGRKIPSAEVAQPPFLLPDVLPAGLADAVAREAGCNAAAWIGTGGARVDDAGRVQQLTLQPLTMSKECQRVVSTLVSLSLASTESVAAPRQTDNLLFVHAAGQLLCLDEAPLGAPPSVPRSVGNGVTAPTVTRRAEPRFPEDARRKMGQGHYVVVIIVATISRDGCVRNVRLVQQSPYPDLNTAAVFALAQWRFAPGRIDGQPVDVIFYLTISFRT